MEETTDNFKVFLETGDLADFGEDVDIVLSNNSDKESAKILAQFLSDYYTTLKSGYIAKLLEIIIRKNRNLALEVYPNNYFYELAVATGSIDIYECYIEEFLEPYFIEIDDADEKFELVFDLLDVTERHNDKLLDRLEVERKGMHFNGIFSTWEENINVALINKVDYDIMDNIVEKYNSIVGRREIIKRLESLLKEVEV